MSSFISYIGVFLAGVLVAVAAFFGYRKGAKSRGYSEIKNLEEQYEKIDSIAKEKHSSGELIDHVNGWIRSSKTDKDPGP